MNSRENQAWDQAVLYEPGVTRQVTRIVHRGDTEHLVPGTHVTMDELHDYQLLGRRLQARAMASVLGSLFAALVWPFKKLRGALARAGREATAIRQLSALDDRLLHDIGIHRDQIPAAVASLLGRPAHVAAHVVPTRPARQSASNDPHLKAAA